jgi:hypothetical protein
MLRCGKGAHLWAAPDKVKRATTSFHLCNHAAAAAFCLSHDCNRGARVQANLLKTCGYLISTFSVVLLGAVAWASSDGNELLRLATIIGVLSSVVGMFMRWLSYQEERDAPVAGRTKRA